LYIFLFQRLVPVRLGGLDEDAAAPEDRNDNRALYPPDHEQTAGGPGVVSESD
jgi:hypothetical protein